MSIVWERTPLGPSEKYPELKAHLERDFENLSIALLEGDAVGGGIMYNAPQNKPLNTLKNVLDGWPNGISTVQITTDPAAGTFELRQGGLFQVSAFVYGLQGSATRDEDIFLGLRVENGPNAGDYDLWNVTVSTNQTLHRSLIFDTLWVGEPGEVLSAYMYATTDLGTFIYERANLRIEQRSVLFEAEQQSGAIANGFI